MPRALVYHEQHLRLFILSLAPLPRLTTKFHPPASVSWICGITDVCATAPAQHSFFGHELKWKAGFHLLETPLLLNTLPCYWGGMGESTSPEVSMSLVWEPYHQFRLLFWGGQTNFILSLWLEQRTIKFVICLRSCVSCLTVQLGKEPWPLSV